MDPASGSTSSGSTGSGEVVRDNYIPLFDGKPSSYREWRKRITLYQKKMKIIKKGPEGVINLLTSFSGPVWKQVEHLADFAPEAEDGFEQVLSTLDKIYQYDSKVEMPRAFERFFYQVGRTPGQTLMAYVSDHREAARELLKYDVRIPPTVDGWLLLRRAGLSAKQRQLIMSQVSKDMKPESVEEALYFLLGQDYKGKTAQESTSRQRPHIPRARPQPPSYSRWSRNWRSPSSHAYATEDEPVEDELLEYQDFDEAYEEFDQDYGDLDDNEDSVEAEDDYLVDHAYVQADDEDLVYEEAYASYLDARRKFAEIKAGRGFYPVVALVDQGPPQPVVATPGPGKGKNKKGASSATSKGKGHGAKVTGKVGKSTTKSTAMARSAATKCLRCGQPGHWAAQCPKPPGSSPTSSPTTAGQAKRLRPSDTMMAVTWDEEHHKPVLPPGRAAGVQDGGA